MAKLKNNMHQHLRSAKEWLTKAEEAFDKQHDIRAELDLMLAEAELQHVKEANRAKQWRYKYVIFRHGMALTLAAFMVVILGGAYWWTTTRPVLTVPVPLAVQATLPVEVIPKKQEVTVPESSPAVIPQGDNKPITPAAKDPERQRLPENPPPVGEVKQSQDQAPIVLSDGEVQKLVRAAGKSLRGQ